MKNMEIIFPIRIRALITQNNSGFISIFLKGRNIYVELGVEKIIFRPKIFFFRKICLD